MVGCGGKQDPAPTPPEVAAVDTSEGSSGLVIPPAAGRIYMLGETRYAEGRFDEAVALWGHAMLQLPSDPAADSIRHKLIARMGYGLLQAHHSTGDMSYLMDGQMMCELYIAKHEELFGDGDDARQERGEIYELLYEFDSRIDGSQEDPELADDDDADVTETEIPADVIAAAPPASSGSSSEAEDYRVVKVRHIAWADPDDPRVRAFARDNRFTGPTLVDIGDENVHDARVLVRVGALPRSAAEGADTTERRAARDAGLAVIDAARPVLERCYEEAMTRDPVFAARVEVTLNVGPDGAVAEPRILKGTVVDAQGDACAAEALRHAMVESPTDSTVALTMPIHFFFQEATKAAELIRIEHRGTRKGYARTGRASGLPPITNFGAITEPYVMSSAARAAQESMRSNYNIDAE